MGGLLRQANPHSVLLILLGGLQSNEGKDDEDGDNQPLHIGEVVQRREELRPAVEDYMAMAVRPHHPYGAGRILLNQLVELAAELVGITQHILGDAVTHNQREVLVGDDEWDVVLRTHDMRDKRVGAVVTEGIATHSLHRRHPQRNIVLLLLTQHVSQPIGIEQRQHRQHRTNHKD